ncbi:LytTR family DNA-binding domain-containing protein [Aquimarina sp. D1M17]|uniref:LytR/AlgR family response regulator transcription factor n=1 Tax=Aquimarina acroporae TaxID=2937283 RepID=UPI0020C03C86|nr:LytTR family DNA-binding domain-containing protein [Aquimarina acroporae]MCK8522471.1 LytTR family DNA-binding domain-containing protein [Aquimarina acroporae]
MNKLIRCVIVDDEPPAIRLLKKYIEKVSFLELVATITNPLEALQILEKEDIDLVFLDIQMPNLTGIQLSKIIKDHIQVIFTTAYPQFALESYDLNATDYLLKPFEFERFYKAVKKVVNNTNTKETASIANDFVFVKTDGKNNFERVKIEEILYIEGLKNYVALHCIGSQIITYNTLKSIKENLPDTDFVQIHKSYVVSLHHIEKTTSTTILINNKELPVGDTYRTNLFKVLNNYKL